MRVFTCLLFIFLQVSLTNIDNNGEHHASFSFSMNFPGYGSLVGMDSLSVLDASLVLITFLLAATVYRRRKLNLKLYTEIETWKRVYIQDSATLGNLQPFLEESRSRNSGIEMPLRKISRQCGSIESELSKMLDGIAKLQQDFGNFKETWQTQSAPLVGFRVEDMIAVADKLKIKAEVDMLRKFIEVEMKSVRFVANYNKSLIEEAEDDVDRVLVSEGL